MRRIGPILIILFCLGLLPVVPAMAGLFGNNTLVSIDGEDYSIDDFKRWWKFWQEEEEALPRTVDPYIDWLLLSREAQQMQFDETPGFKRQTRIFLQSRALLMLKYEEVDSQINISDAEVRARYEEKYIPHWQIQRLQFPNEAAALAAWQKLADNSLTLDQLLELDTENGGPIDTVKNWLRPHQIDPGWTVIFEKLETGQVVDPEEHNKGRILYILKDKKEFEDQDFAKLYDSIKKSLWKEQEDALTQALIDRLRKKYQVKINEERLANLDIHAPEDTFTDEPIITSTSENVSEKEFMAVIRRLIESRPTALQEASDPALVDNLKRETVNNIIYQAVTNWESLDRNFESKEPFKWEYEFNLKHRLVLALEQQLFIPQTEVTEEEIQAYYQKHLSRYTQPTLVKLYIVDETQAPLEQIWAEVAVGKNFQELMKEYFEKPLLPREAPANHLDPEVGEVVARLVDGETSQIFTAQGTKVLVHLVERTPETPLPLERVKQSVRSDIRREKLNKARNEYLDKIKSGTDIEVSERNWKKIQKELGGA